MKLLKLLTLLMIVNPAFSYAQGHSGVGGGDATASDFQDYINKIDAYLLTPEGQAAFPEIKQPDFHNIATQVKPVVKNERVYDSFGIAQTCTSHKEVGNRFFQCDLQRLPKIELNNQPAFYRLALHELLYQVNLELPHSANVPSDFSISSRLKLRLATYQEWIPGQDKNNCTVFIEQDDLYTGSHVIERLDGIQGSGDSSSTTSLSKLNQLLLSKHYAVTTKKEDAVYTLKVSTNYELFHGPWFQVEQNLMLGSEIKAVGNGRAKGFTLDFIAENSSTFKRMKAKAYERALLELSGSISNCQ